MLKGAIIGLGNIATRGHLPAYLDGELRKKCSMVAVMDLAQGSRERSREILPEARFYTNAEELLNSEKLDFVDICTPPHTHVEYIRAFASKGIHIVCEKPLAEKAAVSDKVRRLVRDAGIVYVPCHQYKYSPLWSAIHERITFGVLGEVTLAQFNIYRLQADTGTAGWKPEWRTSKQHSGGGILVDTGAHYFYLAQWFFGMPRKLTATLRTLKHPEYSVEDTALVVLEYPGTLMEINLTWAASHRANSAYIAGTKGSLSYDGTRLMHASAEGVKEIPMPDVSDKNQYIKWYVSLFNDFFCKVETQDRSTNLLEESITVMKLLDLSYRSSAEQRTLELA